MITDPARAERLALDRAHRQIPVPACLRRPLTFSSEQMAALHQYEHDIDQVVSAEIARLMSRSPQEKAHGEVVSPSRRDRRRRSPAVP